MGFFSDFAEGFVTTTTNTLQDRKKRQNEIDDARKKSLALVDAEVEVYERKSRIEEESKRAAEERLANQRSADFDKRLGINAGTPSPTEGQVDAPTSTSAAEREAMFTSAAAKAALRGDDAAYKAYMAQAEVFKLDRTVGKENRDIERQPVLGASGTPVIQEYAKAENERIAKGGSTKFQPKRYTITPGNTSPQNLLIAKKESEDSGLAQEIAAKIAEKTSGKSGVSKLSGPKIIGLAEEIVILKNKIAEPNTPEDVVTENLLELSNKVQELNSYSMGLGDDISQTVFPASMEDTQKAAPVELTSPDGTDVDAATTAALSAARDAIARGAPRDKVLQRLEENGINTTGL